MAMDLRGVDLLIRRLRINKMIVLHLQFKKRAAPSYAHTIYN